MLSSMYENKLHDKGFIFIGDSSIVCEGDMIEVTVGKSDVLLARVDGVVYAVDGICSHAYAKLVEGELDDYCVTCPLHFACFDIRDGEVLEGPADKSLPIFKVVEKDQQIWLKL